MVETNKQPGKENSKCYKLTIGLAGVIDFGEVFVAAALVGSFGVVADVGTNSELLTLVLICEIKQPKSCTLNKLPLRDNMRHSKAGKNRTFTSVLSIGLEAGSAGAEGVGAIHHAVSLVAISTHCPVAAAVVQHRVCRCRNDRHSFKLEKKERGSCTVAARRTFLIAVELIRAVILAVVEVVAAEDAADAAAVGALELVFLARWCRRRHFWRQAQTQFILFFNGNVTFIELANTYGSFVHRCCRHSC